MRTGEEHLERSGRRRSVRVYVALLIAILAVSSSALLVRWADTNPVGLAFWRTLAGAVILGLAARRASPGPTRQQWPFLLVAGLALGIHFSSWLASLELTSVAASVTLVSLAPLIIVFALAASGRPPGPRAWVAVALALVGTVIITAGDIGGDREALIGDGLALVGAGALAMYLMAGDRLRSSLPTSVYASRVYAVAACSLVPALVVFRIPVWGYDRTTWLAILAMIAGPQLAGHTLLNLLLKPLGSLAVSLALLVEPIGATLLVWLALGERPPPAAAIGAPLVLAGLALHLLSGAEGSEPEPVGC